MTGSRVRGRQPGHLRRHEQGAPGDPDSFSWVQQAAGNQAVRRLVAGEARHLPAAAPAVQRSAALVVQRTVARDKAESMLSTIMTDHGRKDWYQQNWKSGRVKAIAAEVAGREDTTKDNLRSRLQMVPEVAAVLRAHRMAPTEEATREVPLDEDLQKVYDAYLSLLFYHTTKAPTGVRASGLDPDFGGSTTGLASTRSLTAKQKENVERSRGRVFVTRKLSEAKGYLETGSEILRVLIPAAMQPSLQVDPDSQFGLYIERQKLKAIDRPSRQLDWWGYSYLASELGSTAPHLLDRLPELYTKLIAVGAFLPGKEEETLDLTRISKVEPMDEDAAFRLAQQVHGAK